MSSSESKLQTILVNLNERTKELNCLYEIDEVLRNYELPIQEILSKLCSVIPKGWQHNDICKAIIIYENKEFSFENFKKSELKQKSVFTIGNKKGEVHVYYIKPVKVHNKSIFLSEEQKLLNTIANKLANHLEHRALKSTIQTLTNDKNIKAVSNNFINEHAYFKGLGLSESQAEIFTKVKLNFKKGETLCKQGALTNYIYFQSNGLAKALLESLNDNNYIFKLIIPYDYIGLSSLFGESTHQFTVTALQDTSVFLIEKEVFQQIFFENKAFAAEIMKWYSNNYETLLSKMSNLSSKQSLGRIADVLIYLSNDIFKSDLIEGCISRRDIAEMAGLSTESAVRILSELKSDNIIKTNKSEIEILNHKALKAISISG